MRRTKFLLTVGVLACLVACGGSPDESEPDSATSTAGSTSAMAVTPTTMLAPAAPVVPTQSPVAEPTYVEPSIAEPVIIDCQQGLGPITTFWSDGTVTGYTDYCQSVHDEALEGEIDANTPVCDGTVCTYPNGATIPDPNAVPDDRCTNRINYANDPRSNAEINSIGESTGQCPEPIA